MAVIRRLREIAAFLKNSYKTILLVSPMLEIPPELEKDVTVVDFDLPRAPDFHDLLNRIAAEVKGNPKIKLNLTPAAREKIVHSLLGLTLAEVEKLNHKPFKLLGFNKDNVAVGSDWNAGTMAAVPGGCKLGVSFRADAKATADALSAFPADKEFSSDDAAMRAVNPKISEILVGY